MKITKGVGGGTSNIHPAMVKGDFDLYPEYTGTRLVGDLEKRHATPTRPIILRVTKRIFPGIRAEMGAPYGFNNAFIAWL